MAKILIFTRRFKKNYQGLPKNIQETFDMKLKLFLENPLHKSFNIHRYKTEKNKKIYEAYINLSYRFTFENEQDSIIFRNIGSHGIIDKGTV